ncbi:hypothetical protein [Rhodohalobacter halophilus]|uniref:hypothetical protein n=1 Tax=Rhodohalobacter halophilus TaxID=1812810 RepID=UPI00083F976B|nr:hypothetical protein [Rhodohalobacter halophilus]
MKDFLIYFLALLLGFTLLHDSNYKKILEIFNKNNNYYSSSPAKLKTSKELAFIYVTSSTCPYCNDEELLSTIDKIKYQLKEKADSMGYNFTAIGVGIEQSSSIGLRHFSKSGFYDEIIVGNSWNNIGSLYYIQDHFKGVAMTPQLIITMRDYQVLNPSDINFRENAGLTNEVELVRKTGLTNISNWYKNGLQIPFNNTD